MPPGNKNLCLGVTYTLLGMRMFRVSDHHLSCPFSLAGASLAGNFPEKILPPDLTLSLADRSSALPHQVCKYTTARTRIERFRAAPALAGICAPRGPRFACDPRRQPVAPQRPSRVRRRPAASPFQRPTSLPRRPRRRSPAARAVATSWSSRSRPAASLACGRQATRLQLSPPLMRRRPHRLATTPTTPATRRSGSGHC